MSALGEASLLDQSIASFMDGGEAKGIPGIYEASRRFEVQSSKLKKSSKQCPTIGF
jgi:hypothetical protein